MPRRPAVSTMAGKGTFRAKIATKAAAARIHSRPFFRAREPMRQAANSTMAVTAGLMP